MVRAFAFAISLFLIVWTMHVDHACLPGHTLTVDKHNIMRVFNG